MDSLNIPKERLEQLYTKQGLLLKEIAGELDCNKNTIVKYLNRYGIPMRTFSETQELCYKRGLKKVYPGFGEINPNWRGGMRRHEKGYIKICNPQHPKAAKDGSVLEHILVWEKTHGQPLPDGWIIHHLNGIKDDNHPENLLAMPRKHHSPALRVQEVQARVRELEAEIRKLKCQSTMVFS